MFQIKSHPFIHSFLELPIPNPYRKEKMNFRLGFLLFHGAVMIVNSTGTPVLRRVQQQSQPTTSDTCLICPGGETITNPEGEIALGVENVRTCAELEENADEILERECPFIQGLAPIICECTEGTEDDEPTTRPDADPHVDDADDDENDGDGTVTLFIKIISENPQNIAWKIGDVAMEDLQVGVPFNAYLPSQTDVSDKVTVTEGEMYHFIIQSKFGDDLGEDGSYEVTLGEDDDIEGQTVLVREMGNFGQEAKHVFKATKDVEAQVAPPPSLAPTTKEDVFPPQPSPVTLQPVQQSTSAPTNGSTPTPRSSSSKTIHIPSWFVLSSTIVLSYWSLAG